jgi:hypothetical protein
MKVALLRVLNLLTRLRHSGALINVCHHEPLPLNWGSRGVQDSQGHGHRTWAEATLRISGRRMVEN